MIQIAAIFLKRDMRRNVLPGAIIMDGDRKRAPFLVLGLAP